MSMFDLAGKVAIVTGGNGGIGLGMAKGMAAAGAAIMIAARNAAKTERALKDVQALGAKADAIALDVTDEKACRSMVAETQSRFGRVDILVNNAGMNIRKRPEEYALKEWHQVIDTNLTSAFVCSQAAHAAFLKAGGGKIINIGSMMSLFGLPVVSVYAASKGGIVQMTKAMATAWAKDNVQVNAVLPGWIDTELTRRGRREIEGLNEKVLARTPAGRWGEPTDMAGIAVFLASAASDFVTGTAIPVDGGYSALG
jgi:2-deoxy-D-gluconate 3-dehydrogenase